MVVKVDVDVQQLRLHVAGTYAFRDKRRVAKCRRELRIGWAAGVGGGGGSRREVCNQSLSACANSSGGH